MVVRSGLWKSNRPLMVDACNVLQHEISAIPISDQPSGRTEDGYSAAHFGQRETHFEAFNKVLLRDTHQDV